MEEEEALHVSLLSYVHTSEEIRIDGRAGGDGRRRREQYTKERRKERAGKEKEIEKGEYKVEKKYGYVRISSGIYGIKMIEDVCKTQKYKL